jgi:hypothetical protein
MAIATGPPLLPGVGGSDYEWLGIPPAGCASSVGERVIEDGASRNIDPIRRDTCPTIRPPSAKMMVRPSIGCSPPTSPVMSRWSLPCSGSAGRRVVPAWSVTVPHLHNAQRRFGRLNPRTRGSACPGVAKLAANAPARTNPTMRILISCGALTCAPRPQRLRRVLSSSASQVIYRPAPAAPATGPDHLRPPHRFWRRDNCAVHRPVAGSDQTVDRLTPLRSIPRSN